MPELKPEALLSRGPAVELYFSVAMEHSRQFPLTQEPKILDLHSPELLPMMKRVVVLANKSYKV